jgi:hypothetical protein
VRETRIGSIDFLPGALRQAPEEGDVYILMEADGQNPPNVNDVAGVLTAPAGFSQTEATGSVGEALDISYAIAATPSRLTATVTSVRPSQLLQAAAAAAGPASLMFRGQGLDLLSDSTTELLASQGQRADSWRGMPPACPRPGVSIAAGVTGRRKGGTLDSRWQAALFSMTCATEAWGGYFLFGGFLEAGEGRYRYDTDAPQGTPDTMRGKISYRSGGLFARYDFKEFRQGHFYLQAAALTGQAETTFGGSAKGMSTYDMTRGFSAGSLTAGFVAWLGWHDTLDFSVRQSVSRMRPGAFVTASGDRVDFEPATSRRTRLSALWSREFSLRSAMRLGVSVDSETDGESRAYSLGTEIPTIPLKGATGTLEAGFDFRPNMGSPFSISLTAQAFTGARRGGSGELTLTYAF